MLTGENIPVKALKDTSVFAGSVLESDEAVIKVENTGASTRIGEILEGVNKNYLGKLSFSTYSDKYAAAFTLLVGVYRHRLLFRYLLDLLAR